MSESGEAAGSAPLACSVEACPPWSRREDDIDDGAGSGRGTEGTALNSERGTGEVA